MTDYVIDTYSRIADKYAERYFDDLSETPYIDGFLELLPADARVLEVGCGPGQFLRYVSQKGFAVEGIDLSPEMLAIAKEKVPDITVTHMDMRSLLFADATFDGIMALYSLIHIPTSAFNTVLSGFHRILKPSGLVEIIVQVGEPDHIENDPLMAGEKIFMNFFTHDRLLSFTEGAGFETVKIIEIDSNDQDSMSTGILHYIGRRM